MRKKKQSASVFKPYVQSQLMLLPPSVDELVEPNHPVRTVSRIIDQVDLSSILSKYKGGGTSSYDPRMLLKVLIYAYLCNVFSSRKIESCLKENIHFMWLSGMSRPDHNTINRFRCDKIKDSLKEVFSQVVMLLVNSELVNLKEIYVDGTKIEANANRYSFVWGKCIKNNEERIRCQLNDLWDYSQQIAAEELNDTEDVDFAVIDAEKVQETIDKINATLAGKEVDKKVRQKLNYARKNWPRNLEKYKRQKEILGDRNSFSKTDEDATFMRMKEDHMRNGQLKPGYNLQISTNNKFIVNYSHHPKPTDTTTLTPHLKEFEKLYGALPEVVVADAGYGSEENYLSLEAMNIQSYVKHNGFDKRSKSKNKITFTYNEEQDCFHCPAGRVLARAYSYTSKTANGFIQEKVRYQSSNCEGCTLRDQCCLGDSNRQLNINHRLRRLRKKADERLTSEKGIEYRKKRGIEVEPVFANIKHNKGFRRFMLRGVAKTEVETGLLALAHNIAKMAA
ncbi:MAG: IS1182 family transposase [Armatimonadetes bacterium]|nr:IS1182 family transposase [Armatimonadota bacterium]